MKTKFRQKSLYLIVLVIVLTIQPILNQSCTGQRCCLISPCTSSYCTQRNTQTWISSQSFSNYQYTKLVLSDNSCKPCSYNCKSCSSILTCSSCAKGFYMSSQTSKCQLCSDRCNSCSVVNSITKCSSCQDGTYLDTTTLTCKSCPSGAKACSSSTAIIQCQVGYKKSSNSLYCTNCPNNCNSCPVNDLLCASCSSGYYLNSNNNCLICTIANCKTCLRSGSIISCTLCNTGYRLSSGQCIACPSNCNTCSSTTVCTQCKNGYYLNGGACSIIQTIVKNCQLYSSSTSCSSCLSGYYLKSNECYPCSLLCATCDNDHFGSCLSCNANADLFNKMCLITNFPSSSTYNLYYSFPYGSVYTSIGTLTCNDKFLSGTSLTLNLNNLKGYRIQLSWRLYSQSGSTTYNINFENSQGNYSLSQSTSSTEKYILCNNSTSNYYISEIKGKIFNTIKKSNALTFSTNNNMIISLHQLIITVYKCNQLCIQCSQTLCTQCLMTKLYTQDAYCVYTCSNNYYIYKNNLNLTNPNQCLQTCPLGSYTFAANVSCVPCKQPCLTCLNDKFCLSCVENYYLTKDNTCNQTCPFKYYGKAQTKTCEKCVGRCLECINQQKCLSCRVGFLYNVTYTCVDTCENTVIASNGLYADLDTLFCQTCDTNCLNCQYTKKRCTQCIPTKYFYDHTCLPQCPAKFYSPINSNICQPCQYPCKTCTSTSTTCTSCIQGYLFSSNSSCVNDCPTGYYEDNVDLKCVICDSKCSECYGSATYCLACQNNFYYYENYCYSTCPDELYQHKTLKICTNCVNLCKTCLNQTYCLSCKSNFLYNGSCIGSGQCPNGYYADIKTLSCKLCSSNCLQCQYSSTTCIKCNVSLITKYLQKNKCVSTCSSNNYYPLSNSTSASCQPCQQPCLTCINSYLCLSCISGYKYSNNICSSTCSVGTYFSSSINDCVNCSSNCQICSDNKFCQKCQNLFYINTISTSQNQCKSICPDTYYAQTLSSSCQKCIYPCSTCISSIDCISCLSGVVYQNRCISSCPDSTYLNILTNQCISCSGNCLTCSTDPTYCTSCKDTFYLYYANHTCISTCPLSLYPEQFTKSCVLCPSTCAECVNSTYCTKCIINKSYKSPSTNLCVQYCPGGYYGNNSTLNCDQCSSTCSSCKNTATNCLACANNYLLIKLSYDNNICQLTCPLRYYAQGSYCYQCSFPCKTCSTSINCLTCVSGTYYHQLSKSCLLNCPSQNYYNFDKQQCIQCKYPCKSCQNDTFCLSCNTNSSNILYLYEGSCISLCPIKYYPDESGICNRCYGLCQTCNSKYYCLTCLAGYAYEGYCYSSCPGGTYANTITKKCQNCDPKCSQCILSSTYCTKCSGGLYVYKGNCSSKCPSGTYQDNAQCISCTFPCVNCKNKNTCQQCLGGYLLYMNISCIDDVTPCPNDFYKMDSKACVPITWCPSNYFIDQKQKTCSSKCDRKKYTYSNSTQKKCLDLCPTGYYAGVSMICQQWLTSPALSLMTMSSITYISSSYLYIQIIFNQTVKWSDIQTNMYIYSLIQSQSLQSRRMLFTQYKIPEYILDISTPSLMKLKINNYPQRIGVTLAAYRLTSVETNYPLQNPFQMVDMPQFTAYSNSQIYSGIIVGQFSQGICWFIMLLSIFFLFKNRLSDLYVLWDTAQLLFSLIFLNIQYPPNLNQFLYGLKYMYFTFLPSIFTSSSRRNISDPPFYSYSYDNSFLRNSGGIFFAMIVVFGILLLLKISQQLIRRVDSIKQKAKQYPSIKGFIYKGILRYRWHHTSDFMFLSYPIIILFAIAQLKFISQNTDNLFSNALAIILLIVYVIWVVFVGYKLYKHFKNISKGKLVNNLKCFYRGIQKQNKFGIALVLVRYARKFFYCLIISIFSTNPMYALPILMFLSVLMLVFLFVNLPFKKKLSNMINIIAEGILVITYIFIALINFNNNDFSPNVKHSLGWICCIILAIMIFILIYEVFCKTMFYLESQQQSINAKIDPEKIKNLNEKEKQYLRKKAEEFFDSLLPKLKEKFNFDQDSDDQLYNYEQGDSDNSENNQQRQKDWNDSEDQDQFKHYDNGSQNQSQQPTDLKSKNQLKAAPQYLVRCVKDIQ